MSDLNPFEDTQSLAIYAEEILHEYAPSNITNSGYGHLVFSCPLCNEGKAGSRKRRGNWYGDTASYYCFNAGCIANDHPLSALAFTAALKNIDKAAENVNYIKWFNQSVKNHGNKDVPQFDDKKEEKQNTYAQNQNKSESMFEDTWVELPDIVRNYCNERRLFEAPFKPPYWDLYFDLATKRLVIPWQNSIGECVYWQKRALIKGDSPKYLYAKGSKRPIFNPEAISNDFPYIFIHEGALDSIFVYSSVAVGAISPSDSQSIELSDRFPMHERVYFTDNPWVDTSCMKMLIGDYASQQRGILDRPTADKFFAWPQKCKFKDVNECICNEEGAMEKFSDPNWLQAHIVNSLQMKLILKRTVDFNEW
jgi:hypothetical protein